MTLSRLLWVLVVWIVLVFLGASLGFWWASLIIFGVFALIIVIGRRELLKKPQ